MQVAQTILSQLGGSRFQIMTGASRLAGDDKSLSFSLPNRFCKDDINKVRITLTPADEYDMEFFRIRGTHVTLVHKVAGVYCDQLQEIFTDKTGLYTTL